MRKKTMTKKRTAKNKKEKIEKNNNWRPEHISYSQIQDGQCLHHYYLKRILHKYESGGEALTAGHCAHKIIYEYTRALYDLRINSDFQIMENLINKYFDEYNLKESQYVDMRKALLEFGERGIDTDKLLTFEQECEVTLNDGGKFKAVIDRVNSYASESNGSCLEIIDYKNHLNIISKTEVEKDEQLSIYKWLVCKKLYPNFDSVRVGIHHIKYNYVVFSDWQKIPDLEKEFENMEAYLNRQYKRLIKNKNASYIPTRCNVCYMYGGCPVLLDGKCPLYDRKSINTVIKKNDTAELVRALRQAEIISESIKEKLKRITAEQGPQLVDDAWYGYVPTESYKYELEQAIEFCHKYQIPLSDVKSFNRTDFEKAVKVFFGHNEFKGYEDELKVFRIYEKKTTFKKW